MVVSCTLAVLVNVSQFMCLGRFSAVSFQVRTTGWPVSIALCHSWAELCPACCGCSRCAHRLLHMPGRASVVSTAAAANQALIGVKCTHCLKGFVTGPFRRCWATARPSWCCWAAGPSWATPSPPRSLRAWRWRCPAWSGALEGLGAVPCCGRVSGLGLLLWRCSDVCLCAGGRPRLGSARGAWVCLSCWVARACPALCWQSCIPPAIRQPLTQGPAAAPAARRYGTASAKAAKPAIKVKAHTPSAEEAEKQSLLAQAALGDKLDSECVGCPASLPAASAAAPCRMRAVATTCLLPLECRMRAVAAPGGLFAAPSGLRRSAACCVRATGECAAAHMHRTSPLGLTRR